jgi:cobalamin-dependent methionine synthase I
MPPRINRGEEPEEAEARRQREIHRRDEMRRLKNEHIQKRRERLAELQAADAQQEAWALKRDWFSNEQVVKGLLALPPYLYDGPKLFTSRSMDGREGYILEEISRYINSIVKKETQEKIDKLMSNGKWLERDTFYYGGVSISYE